MSLRTLAPEAYMVVLKFENCDVWFMCIKVMIYLRFTHNLRYDAENGSAC